MLYPLPEDFVIDEAANPKYGDATTSEIRRAETSATNRGYYRVIGGSEGDLVFNGYTVSGGKTTLVDPALWICADDLDEDEATDIARAVFDEAYSSIGLEAIGDCG